MPKPTPTGCTEAETDLLCVGDISCDLFVSLPHLPGLDEKVTGRRLGQAPGGMAANVAVSASRLGRSARLMGAVGGDAAGQSALDSLAAEGVDVRPVIAHANHPTSVCVVLLTPGGEKALIRVRAPKPPGLRPSLAPKAFDGVTHVHLTYGDRDLTVAALDLAGARGLATSLDLEAADAVGDPAVLARALAAVDTLFVNQAGKAAAERLLARSLDAGAPGLPPVIVLTRGADGCEYHGPEGRIEWPAMAAQVKDTTGAGDCFAAAYITGLLEGASPGQRLRFATAAAGLSTQTYGAQPGMPDRASVEKLLSGRA